MNKLLNLLLSGLLLVGCNKYPKPAVPTQEEDVQLTRYPKNVILMIGDGMGLTQITAGMYFNGNKLNLEKFPIVGLHKPYSSNNLITDSAAGATAFASGIKTYNGAIGVNTDTLPVKTILEQAEENGMATGMIATSQITHATPASFIAHVKSRNLQEEIAEDFLKTEIDFFVGGGKSYFDESRKDGQNLYLKLQENGYFVSDFTRERLEEIVVNFDENFAYFTADIQPEPSVKGRDYLMPASKLATVFLHNRSQKGFFLMIEGSQIDWAGHENNSEYIISEMIDFDRAIGEVLEFAREDGETLIIVTADHETGGYAINPGSKMDSIVGSFTTDYHTATLIPVFAYGPGSELFGGIYENTAIYEKMRNALRFRRNLN